jgi:hypothetical protein
LNDEESQYWWYDRVPSDDELKDTAEELIPGHLQNSERGCQYGFDKIDRLPDDVRTSLLDGFRGKKAYAEKMIELLEVTEVMEG